MELDPYVASLQQQLALAADAGGDDARALAARLAPSLEATTRLVLLEALADAAGQITVDLAPGSVELRLRGRDPDFVVTVPEREPAAPPEEESHHPASAAGPVDGDDADGGTARLTLRLPDHLKRRVEEGAAAQGQSVNAWLVRAVTDALTAGGAARRPAVRATDTRFTGWVS